MRPTIKRLEDLGQYRRYEMTVGKVSGEAIALPEHAEGALNDLLAELNKFAAH